MSKNSVAAGSVLEWMPVTAKIQNSYAGNMKQLRRRHGAVVPETSVKKAIDSGRKNRVALSECMTTVNEQGMELIEHGSALFPAACYYDNLAEEDVPWHWHEELELILVSEGESVVAAGTEKYIIKEGNGIFINSGILHAAWKHTEGACRFHSIVFHPRLVGGSADSVFWQNYLRPLMEDGTLSGVYLDRDTEWQREILTFLEHAWQSDVAEQPGYEFEVRENLSRIVSCLVLRKPAPGKTLSEKCLREEGRMKLMLQYIQEHCEEEVTVTGIAESASVSISECLRCFHNTIGVPPIQYVLQYRLQMAAGLLAETDRKIADIGMQCGFQDLSYFARMFRRLKGCTPSEYRKRKRNSNCSS